MTAQGTPPLCSFKIVRSIYVGPRQATSVPEFNGDSFHLLIAVPGIFCSVSESIQKPVQGESVRLPARQ